MTADFRCALLFAFEGSQAWLLEKHQHPCHVWRNCQDRYCKLCSKHSGFLLKNIAADIWDSKVYHGSSNELHDVKVGGYIMMELMHHEWPTDSKICVLDSRRSAEVVEFLAQIEFGLSAAELAKVVSNLELNIEHFNNMLISAPVPCNPWRHLYMEYWSTVRLDIWDCILLANWL